MTIFKVSKHECRIFKCNKDLKKGLLTMGMAASQARLLSITARLSDNEQSGQAISYAKESLATETDQINTEYNNALAATKYTVLTSFDGSTANYDDLSYSVLTGTASAELGKQYIVTDTQGRILVTNTIAEAYEESNGNLNEFLKLVSGTDTKYSISDIDPSLKASNKPTDTEDDNYAAYEDAEQLIHEAWDAYFASIGISYDDTDHDPIISWYEDEDDFSYATYTYYNTDDDGNYIITGYELATDDDGNTLYDDDGEKIYNPIYQTTTIPLNFDGTTSEQRALYDYAMALTESYYSTTEYDSTSTYKTAYDADNQSIITYYQNIFEKMQSSDYFTYTSDSSKVDGVHWLSSSGTANSKSTGLSDEDINASPLNDASTLVTMLESGQLLLEYYSTTDGEFVSTSLSSDESIEEVSDESAIAAAEIEYEQALEALELKDSKYDMQLKKLDTEHDALQTEYDSVKNVIDKNIEKSFSVFS